MKRLRLVVYRLCLFILHAVFVPFFLAAYVIVLPFARTATSIRRYSKKMPRLLWGTTPVINISYFSRCLLEAGYHSRTHVTEVFHINTRQDFDYVRADVLGIPILGRLVYSIAPYFEFIPMLLKFDIFHYDFNGGILYTTPLKYIEVELLHLAGKLVVMMPYGGDAYVYNRVLSVPVRHALLAQWPALGRNYAEIERQVDYFSAKADFVMSGFICPDGLPRWDMLVPNFIVIDTRLWENREDILRKEKIVFVHAPNHRGVKGTEYFLEAIQRLKSEGHPVDLVLIEKMPNSDVRRIMKECDIVLDQLILVGYGLTAIEGMASGKLVVSNLSDSRYCRVFRYYSYLSECPIVSATPASVYDVLREIITNREKYMDRGVRGREYVMKYHSYRAGNLMWGRIYEKIWYGEDVDTMNYFHPLIGDFRKQAR